MAVANYQAAHGHYPPAFIADENGKPMHSWRVLLLPYIDEHELFQRYDFAQAWNSEANLKLASEMPSIYAFHGDDLPGNVTTNYLAVVGENTLWPGASTLSDHEITDSRATTIMLVENSGEHVHWMEPRDLKVDSMSLVVNDPRGVSSKYVDPAIVMLDGSLRRLEDELPEDIFLALLTVNGGERIESSGNQWRRLSDGRSRNERQDDAGFPD